jgi:hypothetical protein
MWSGKEILTLFLDRCRDQPRVIEHVTSKIMKEFDRRVVAFLLDQCEKITADESLSWQADILSFPAC